MTPQSPSKWAPWDLTQFSPLPSATLPYVPESHRQSEISSPSQTSGPQKSQGTKPGLQGAESPGGCDAPPENSAGVVMPVWPNGRGEAANHQLPAATAFCIVSVEERSGLIYNLMQIHRSAHSVILNVTATQDTRSLNGVYRPPRTSTVKSSLFTHVHSRPLSLTCSLVNVVQTILIILTVAGFFQTDFTYQCLIYRVYKHQVFTILSGTHRLLGMVDIQKA